MIEVIEDITLLSKRLGLNIQSFPPFYFNEYYKGQTTKIVYLVSNHTVVPLALSKHYFLKKAQFLFAPLNEGQRLSEKDERTFFEAAIAFMIREKKADRILPPPNYVIFKAVPKGAVSCGFGTYYLDLSVSVDELWNNIHPKHKNVIRNAEKKGAQIKIGRDQRNTFYELYSATMSRSGLSHPSRSYFSNLTDNLPVGNLLCAVAYYNGIPQGALLIPYSEYGAYYVFGASAGNVELTGINNYMHWEIIKYLKEKGVQRYDFVGARLSDVSDTKLHGIQQFKERFGSQLEKGFLWKMDLNWKCALYDFLVKFKNRLMFKANNYIDIIDQERMKNASK